MDDSARDIDAELKQIPQSLEELRDSVQTLETMLAQEREQLAEAEQLKVQQSTELKERNEGLQRARKKVAQASSIREADAAEREVEANRRSIKEREDELGRIGQAIEAKTASLAEREKDFEEAKGVLQSKEESSKSPHRGARRAARQDAQRSRLTRRQGSEARRQALRASQDRHHQRGHHHQRRHVHRLPHGASAPAQHRATARKRAAPVPPLPPDHHSQTVLD